MTRSYMTQITLGRYLWERIHQVGVDTIFGVPGDFNLQFLDEIFEVEGLNWIGNQNELNAAYAADGYGRIKGAPGCLLTTHGVGELSAINGVAGAMCENVKLIHVVGQTTRPMQKQNLMIHHSIGTKPDHQLYNKASAPIRCDAAELWDVKTAPAEIDRVIRECFIKSGSVYIYLPHDLAVEMVPADLLKTPIDTSPYVDEAAQDIAVKAITTAISEASAPAILIDGLAKRFNATPEARDLVSKLNVPFFSTNMSKGVVDETDKSYVGLWNGVISSPGVHKAAKQSDLMITLGYLPCDLNTSGFSRNLDEKKTIHINPFDVVVKGTTYSNTSIKPLLAALVQALPQMAQHIVPMPKLPPARVPLDKNATHITQSHLWPTIESFLRPGDVVLSETGTSSFAFIDVTFPANTQYESQIYYGSIGWATPATLGAEIARREIVGEKEGRTVLCTGDGSLAMTMQEVGTMIKAKCKIVMFVVNNSGYTVERMIWGAQQVYNDIPPTTYSHLLPLFNHPSPSTAYHLATDKSSLATILAKPELQNPQHLQLVEVIVDKMDTSWPLSSLVAGGSKKGEDYLTKEGFVDTYGGWGLDEIGSGAMRWGSV